VLHNTGGDITHSQECAACLGRFAGREEREALVLCAEFLFQEGGEPKFIIDQLDGGTAVDK
jgi:hypothetical protein